MNYPHPTNFTGEVGEVVNSRRGVDENFRVRKGFSPPALRLAQKSDYGGHLRRGKGARAAVVAQGGQLLRQGRIVGNPCPQLAEGVLGVDVGVVELCQLGASVGAHGEGGAL